MPGLISTGANTIRNIDLGLYFLCTSNLMNKHAARRLVFPVIVSSSGRVCECSLLADGAHGSE